MCGPQPVAYLTQLYHTLKSHTSSCTYCDLSCLSARAYNSFSLYVTLYNLFFQVTMLSGITSQKKQQQRSCGWWNRTYTLNSCPLLFAKGHPTSWASTNWYSVSLIRDSCSSGRNRSDMPCWFGAQDATIGYDVAIFSRWMSEFYLTIHVTWCFSDRASWIDYILITNLMHWLLFIHKIIFSSTYFEPQVLIFRRIQLYTCSLWYCHSLWEFLVACR